MTREVWAAAKAVAKAGVETERTLHGWRMWYEHRSKVNKKKGHKKQGDIYFQKQRPEGDDAAAAAATADGADSALAAAADGGGGGSGGGQANSKKRKRCGSCPGCRSAECGVCAQCRSMTKYGG